MHVGQFVIVAGKLNEFGNFTGWAYFNLNIGKDVVDQQLIKVIAEEKLLTFWEDDWSTIKNF